MKEIYEMKGEGYSIWDIARELGIAPNPVRRYLKDTEALALAELGSTTTGQVAPPAA